MPKYALFLYNHYEASGGLDDLVLKGTLEECKQRAIKSRMEEMSQIACIENLKIVMRGSWVRVGDIYVPSTLQYEYKWVDEDAIC